MTELLAPAGTMEAFKAAIANGADAVYVGGKQFSARAFADNFSDQELAEALKLAHFYNKKVYLAINTLLNDGELQQALNYIAHFYSLGLDAVIVQDLGLLTAIAKYMPDLPIHASTQMTTTNLAGVQYLASLGVKRVILARELTFEEIKAIKAATDVELEIFIHGALCICYSGQCLMSSLIGGRSGNRGRCAQPCRLPYQLCNADGDALNPKETGRHLLSPKDLVGYMRLDELHELGLSSWKIEGRMKKPEYVATVCRIYSEHLGLLNQRRVIYLEEEEQRQLIQMFNRDFCHGYWDGVSGAKMMSFKRPNNRGVFIGRIQNRSKDYINIKLEQNLGLGDGLEIWVTNGGRSGLTIDKIMVDNQEVDRAFPGQNVLIYAPDGKVGDRIFKTFDHQLHQIAQESYKDLPTKPLYFTLKALKNAPLQISVRDEKGFEAEITSGYIVEEALNSMSDWQTVQVQLARLGGTNYHLAALDGEMDDMVMLPASVLNACRRQLVADLEAKEAAIFARPQPQIPKLWPLATAPKHNIKQITMAALIDDPFWALRLIRAGIKDIYLSTEAFTGKQQIDNIDIAALLAKIADTDGRLIINLPQIIGALAEDIWLKRIANWQLAGLKAIRINHISQLQLLKRAAWQGAILGGYSLNILNSQTAEFLAKSKLEAVTISPEADLALLRTLSDKGAKHEIMAQGAMTMMISQFCTLGALLGGKNGNNACSAPCKQLKGYSLRDEKGFLFPVRSDNECRMHIFNSKELCLLDEIPSLIQAGISRYCLDLRLYDQAKAYRLAEIYGMIANDIWNFDQAKEKIKQVMEDFTKGHLHRGV